MSKGDESSVIEIKKDMENINRLFSINICVYLKIDYFFYPYIMYYFYKFCNKYEAK